MNDKLLGDDVESQEEGHVEIRGNSKVCKDEHDKETEEVIDDIKMDDGNGISLEGTYSEMLNDSKNSFAEKVNCSKNEDNKLKLIPTVVIDKGQEFVIFDEEIVNESAGRNGRTTLGYFVWYRMLVQELRYNIYRMWSKFRLKHVLNNGNGVFVFKYDNKQGLQNVIESGTWIVNGKPMVVQKWDPSVSLDKTEPSTLLYQSGSK
ncbi:RNA-directed DNA polymerase, eukaryota, reverse transcriptase zinc-binding domain protein [Tanacetum coccineum]